LPDLLLLVYWGHFSFRIDSNLFDVVDSFGLKVTFSKSAKTPVDSVNSSGFGGTGRKVAGATCTREVLQEWQVRFSDPVPPCETWIFSALGNGESTLEYTNPETNVL